MAIPIASVLLAATTTLVALPARAAETCGSTATFFNWDCSSDDKNIIMDALISILNWAAVGVSVVVVIGIIYGGIMIASAGGNESQMKKGITIIRNAVIALILYFGMWAILNFLIPGGLFN